VEQQYRVVVNDEGQYSIWPADRAGVPGWQDEGFVGSKAESLAHIGEVWHDIRPANLRA
jgi:MbtH protein